jgi:hypothetical protein
MFWIEYRDLTARELVRFETDELGPATFLLQALVITPDHELIDFSGQLDGVLDYQLAGVKLFPENDPVKAA